jgi:hypothetical protein
VTYNKGMLNKKGSKMKMKIAAVAVIGSMLAAPAFAWGDREQGILTGIAGLWLWQRLNQPPVVVQQAPLSFPVPQGPMVGQFPTPTQFPTQTMPFPVPQGPMVGQFPTQTMPHIFTNPNIMLNPNCRQVLSIQYDRFGNEYRYPVTVCN